MGLIANASLADPAGRGRTDRPDRPCELLVPQVSGPDRTGPDYLAWAWGDYGSEGWGFESLLAH